MRTNSIIMAVAASVVMMMASCTSWVQKRNIDQAIQQVMNEFEAVGISAAVVQDGKIVYENAFGYANLDSQIPLTTNHFMQRSHWLPSAQSTSPRYTYHLAHGALTYSELPRPRELFHTRSYQSCCEWWLRRNLLWLCSRYWLQLLKSGSQLRRRYLRESFWCAFRSLCEG